MALVQCQFYSEVLNLSMSMNVILPQKGKNHPTLYLLHGLSDNHSIWLRRTSIERYVDGMNLAIVMPEVHRSFYTDMACGGRYWTYISEELPEIAQSMFSLSDKREQTYVAGLSMGGYGAFKLALGKPETFSAGASLSGALDIVYRSKDKSIISKWEDIFGDLNDLPGSENDLFHLSEVVQKSKFKPRLYQCCGTEDFLYQDNLNFLDHATKLGLDLTYEEGPGDHQWGYWDTQIQRVLKWLYI